MTSSSTQLKSACDNVHALSKIGRTPGHGKCGIGRTPGHGKCEIGRTPGHGKVQDRALLIEGGDWWLLQGERSVNVSGAARPRWQEKRLS